jgi:Holliday junction resolvase RusA-like endonuclease
MDLNEVKSAIRDLTPQDRRKAALYILELEKEQVQRNIGPQIARDVDAVSKAVQDAMQKVKEYFDKH